MPNIYSIKFLASASNKWHTIYTISLTIFILAMDCALLSAHLALYWVFLEFTTVASATLIYYNRTKTALEAAWKYVFICSVGISLAFIGIILLSFSTAETQSLFYSDLFNNAKNISLFWLKLAFPFMLIGFSVKAGLAPVHNWLPDAHSEAPSPISAILSGALLNVAFYGIINLIKLMRYAGLLKPALNLLIFMGIISIIISALFIFRVKNYKRLLAYSSIENIGIIALAFGLNTKLAVAAGIIHIISHSLIKSAFFLTSGNILHIYNSKYKKDVTGINNIDIISGWLWILCAAAICAVPPFSTFYSEFLIIRELISLKYYYLLVLMLLPLIFIFYSFFNISITMTFGELKTNIRLINLERSIFIYAPQIILLSLSIIIGLFLPVRLMNFIARAVFEYWK